jgi:hypothetical protein
MAMMKFRSMIQSLQSPNRRLVEEPNGAMRHEPPIDAPRIDDVLFEIGVILAAHLGVALVVALLLSDCAHC